MVIVLLVILFTIFCQVFGKSNCNLQNQQNCPQCVHYFVVWGELKREIIFGSQQQEQQIKDHLGYCFSEKKFDDDEIVMEQWNKELQEYFELNDNNSTIPNNTKINIKEIPNVIVTERGLYSNPNTTYPKDITPIQAEEDLRNELLKNYNKNIWPWTKMNSTCYIQTNIMFHKIIDMDLSHGSLSMLVWLRLRWNDPRFTWDPRDWNNITSVHFNQEEFWDPHIEILNSMESTDKSFDPQMAIVGYKGDLFWSRMGYIQISCNMKQKGVSDFPYVASQCLFEVGSWAYDSSKVYMSRFKGGYQMITDDILKSRPPFALYRINDVRTELISYPPFDSLPQNSGWTSIQFDVTIHRDLRQDTIGILVSKALLTFVSFGAFWLPPSGGERIGFTIIIVLAIELVSFQQLSSSSKFSLGCFSFALFVVIETIFTALLWQRTDQYCQYTQMTLKEQWRDVIGAVEIQMARQKLSQNSKSQSFSIVMGAVLTLVGVLGLIFNYNDFLTLMVLGVILLALGIYLFFWRQISRLIGPIRRSLDCVCECQRPTPNNSVVRDDANAKCNLSNNHYLLLLLFLYYLNKKVKQSGTTHTQSRRQNMSQNLNIVCSQTSHDVPEIEVAQHQQPKQQQILEEVSNGSTVERLIKFPLQNIQQAQDFLDQVLDNKQYEYARKSFKQLCQIYSEDYVKRELFRTMGIEQWRSFSNKIDKICQFTVIPLFLLFVILTILQKL